MKFKLTGTMIFRIATIVDITAERAMVIAPVFAALGPVYRVPNAMNRFAYSRREVLFAM